MTKAVEVVHGAVVYRIIPLEDCLDLANALRAAGRKWHSHVLSPGCLHNPLPEQFGVVIEDDADGIAYLAHSRDFPEVDKDLVKMLHGDDILDAGKACGDNEKVAASTLLPRVREIAAGGAHWHHHMHFPDCVFNPHRGLWSISVEDGRGGVFSETYDDEPVDVLREIEVIYFARFEKGAAEG